MKKLYLTVLLLAGCTQSYHDIPVFISSGVNVSYYSDNPDGEYTLSEQIYLKWNEDSAFEVSNYNHTKKNKHKKLVDSCQSILEAYPQGYWPVSQLNFDNDRYRYLYAECKSVDISRKLYNSNRSYLSGFHLNIENIKGLPKNMAFILSKSEYKNIHNNPKIKTLEDVNNYFTSHIVKITKKNDLRVIVEDDSHGIQDISVLAKGDFNHDQIEDILLLVSNSINGSSYTSYYLYVLTKTEKNGDWVVLDEFPKIN